MANCTKIVSVALVALTLAISSPAQGGNWPQWRGPNFNGSTDETDLPSEFSQTENIAWSADLPGPSAATPIIWEDHVFISSTDLANEKLMAMCFDRKSGKLRWQHDIAKGLRKDYRSYFTAPSPATDGKIVVFFYGNGDLVAFDFDGEKLWSRNIQKDYGTFAFLWTFSSTPLLHGGKLYLQVLQRDTPVDGRGFADRKNESYLLAMDPATGKELWRHIRPSKARVESLEAFSTPIPFRFEDRDELLIVGGDAITGHNPATGKELWRWGTWNPKRITHWRLVPSPVSGGGVLLACAPKRDPIYAVKAGGSGLLDDDALAWVSREAPELSSDVPTPAFYDGDFFILSDVRKALSRVEPKTGKVKWTIKTPGMAKYEASPLAADGKIYLINFSGQVVIVNAADGDVMNVIAMDKPADDVVRSTISAAGGQLFIRTNRKLFCVGK